ncbi:hypothetical protein ACFX2G_005093 [Malus domestica]
MTIKLKYEFIVNSFKTIDSCGVNVHVHHCKPANNTNIASSPTYVGWRDKSDGDGISLFGARKIWIDHCSLSFYTDGLIDAIMGPPESQLPELLSHLTPWGMLVQLSLERLPARPMTLLVTEQQLPQFLHGK